MHQQQLQQQPPNIMKVKKKMEPVHKPKQILNHKKIACLMGNVQDDYLETHHRENRVKTSLKLYKEESSCTLHTSQQIFDEVGFIFCARFSTPL